MNVVVKGLAAIGAAFFLLVAIVAYIVVALLPYAIATAVVVLTLRLMGVIS